MINNLNKFFPKAARLIQDYTACEDVILQQVYERLLEIARELK